jgi:hypothetical protein
MTEEQEAAFAERLRTLSREQLEQKLVAINHAYGTYVAKHGNQPDNLTAQLEVVLKELNTR